MAKKPVKKSPARKPSGIVINIDARGANRDHIRDLRQFGERLQQAATSESASGVRPPAIGQPWRGQGGIYAGLMRGQGGNPDYHLVLATAEVSKFKDAAYGCDDIDVSGARDEFDGLANTEAMAKVGSTLATDIRALKIDGHADFYLPARFESALLYATLRDHLETGYWHWTSTQDSADDAWYQYFDTGGQDWDIKHFKGRARAVRRIPA